jgi:hypothetical protein
MFNPDNLFTHLYELIAKSCRFPGTGLRGTKRVSPKGMIQVDLRAVQRDTLPDLDGMARRMLVLLKESGALHTGESSAPNGVFLNVTGTIWLIP